MTEPETPPERRRPVFPWTLAAYVAVFLVIGVALFTATWPMSPFGLHRRVKALEDWARTHRCP